LENSLVGLASTISVAPIDRLGVGVIITPGSSVIIESPVGSGAVTGLHEQMIRIINGMNNAGGKYLLMGSITGE